MSWDIIIYYQQSLWDSISDCFLSFADDGDKKHSMQRGQLDCFDQTSTYKFKKKHAAFKITSIIIKHKFQVSIGN